MRLGTTLARDISNSGMASQIDIGGISLLVRPVYGLEIGQ